MTSHDEATAITASDNLNSLIQQTLQLGADGAEDGHDYADTSAAGQRTETMELMAEDPDNGTLAGPGMPVMSGFSLTRC